MRTSNVLLAVFALWAGAVGCKKKGSQKTPAAEQQEQADQQEAENDDQDLTPEEMEVVEE